MNITDEDTHDLMGDSLLQLPIAFLFALSILNSFRHTKYRENRVCAKKINKRMHWLQRKMKVNPNMYKNAPPLNTQQIWQTRNVEEFVEELQFFLSRDGLFLQIQN